jgi:hypothetical protein
MTALILAAGADADTAERPRPVSWRRMVWVTWRHHRATFISVPAVLGAISVFLVVAGVRVHSRYAALIAMPVNSAAWQQQNIEFNSVDWTLGYTLLLLMQLVPVLIGAFAGAPVLARDLETGTFRYMWTQGAGRVRPTIARLVLAGVFVSVLAGVVGQLFAWFFQPALENAGDSGMTVLTESVFHSRGFVYPAWTLTTFVIGAFPGMLLRRTLPAMAVTMGAYAGLYILAWRVLSPRYPVSLVTSNPHLIQVAGNVPANVLNTSPWVLSSWQTGSTVWWRYIPVSRFWPMQFIEAGWLVVLSILLIAATVWLARRRAV